MTESVLVVPGDGIGREVVPAAVEVLEAVANIEFFYAEAGDHVRRETGEALPEETYRRAGEADATLFGAAGESATDVVLPLREAVGSFANVRPARAYPGVGALRSETDLVFIRENTEGVYAGIESEIDDGVTTLTRVVTEEASRRIAEFGFEYAADNGYDNVTVAHKANVMRTTDGQFLEAVEAVAEERAGRSTTDGASSGAASAEGAGRSTADRASGGTASPDYETALMDALAMHLVEQPEEYGVIICPNLAGDVLSDLAAGLVGGLGLLPSANVGADNALFEPVHGSAPDIAGEGVANPTATVLSGAMLLEHLGYEAGATAVRSAVEGVLADGPRTPDLGGNATTEDVTAAVLAAL